MYRKGEFAVNPGRMAEIIKRSLTAKNNRQGIFAEISAMPEEGFIRFIHSFGNLHGDPRFAANALFLTTTFVFGSKTAHFFAQIDKNLAFIEKNSWLFQPEEVMKRSEKTVQNTLRKAFRPAGRSVNALPGWRHNCKVLHQKYHDDVRQFFAANDNDATKIYTALIHYPRAKTWQKEFRRYGVKLPAMLFQWLDQYGIYNLKNVDQAGIPSDYQKARVAIQTGAISLRRPTDAHIVTHDLLRPLFDQTCEDNRLPRRPASDALWIIGAYCCPEKRHSDCPLADLCTKLIAAPYKPGARFDPRDVGRFK